MYVARRQSVLEDVSRDDAQAPRRLHGADDLRQVKQRAAQARVCRTTIPTSCVPLLRAAGWPVTGIRRGTYTTSKWAAVPSAGGHPDDVAALLDVAFPYLVPRNDQCEGPKSTIRRPRPRPLPLRSEQSIPVLRRLERATADEFWSEIESHCVAERPAKRGYSSREAVLARAERVLVLDREGAVVAGLAQRGGERPPERNGVPVPD